MLVPGDNIARRYQLARPLAQGGMGALWIARDLQLARDVAIKLMAPAAFALPDLVKRFEREARAAAQLRSAHVVQIFEHGIEGNQPFIVMELLEGEDLAARLRRVGRMSIDDAARLVGDVCKALRIAHEAGIVHRDLKPANIFLAKQDDGEVIKVLDFGVAKVTSSEAEMTGTNDLLGTPHYMAPEQVRSAGLPVDHRADLWALGVITFRAITGGLPFQGNTPMEVLMNVLQQPVPVPSSIAPDLDVEVDRFFAIALERDRARRFASAQSFREALMRLARSGGEPQRAPSAQQARGTGPPVVAPPAPPPSAEQPPLAQLRSTVPIIGPVVPVWPPRSGDGPVAASSTECIPAASAAGREPTPDKVSGPVPPTVTPSTATATAAPRRAILGTRWIAWAALGAGLVVIVFIVIATAFLRPGVDSGPVTVPAIEPSSTSMSDVVPTSQGPHTAPTTDMGWNTGAAAATTATTPDAPSSSTRASATATAATLSSARESASSSSSVAPTGTATSSATKSRTLDKWED